jgi:hypothetical protein
MERLFPEPPKTGTSENRLISLAPDVVGFQRFHCTSKQYLLACQTVFRRHYKQTYSCKIGRRQTAYIEYILKCLFIWQC